MRPHSPQPPGDEAGRGQGRLWDPTAAAHGPGFARGSPRPATQGKKKKKDKSPKEKKQIASRVSISAPWQLAQGTGLGLTAAEIWVAQRWAGHPALLAHGHFQELDFWLSQHPAAGCWGWPGAPPQGPPTVPARADLEPSSPSDLMCSCREKKKKKVPVPFRKVWGRHVPGCSWIRCWQREDDLVFCTSRASSLSYISRSAELLPWKRLLAKLSLPPGI